MRQINHIIGCFCRECYADNLATSVSVTQLTPPAPPEPREPAARDWLNKKHFTADSGVTLDCLAMLPDEHVIALNIRQLTQIMEAYSAELRAERDKLRKLLNDQTCSIVSCGHADCNKIRAALAITSAPEGTVLDGKK